MELKKEELASFNRVRFYNGKNSIFYLDPSGKLLLKEFKKTTDYKKDNVKFLLKHPTIENSGYPLDELIIDGILSGYVCKLYEEALPFGRKSSFSLGQKCKAIKDGCDQLKEVHAYDIVFNDMNRYNQLIDEKGGHLIDFENICIPGMSEIVPSKLYFLYSHRKTLASSKKVDQFKQYVADFSLLYQINFDVFFSIDQANIEDFVDFFSCNKTIYDFMKRQLACLLDPNVELLEYFDVLLPEFSDEKKITCEKKVMKRNLRVYRLPNL